MNRKEFVPNLCANEESRGYETNPVVHPMSLIYEPEEELPPLDNPNNIIVYDFVFFTTTNYTHKIWIDFKLIYK